MLTEESFHLTRPESGAQTTAVQALAARPHPSSTSVMPALGKGKTTSLRWQANKEGVTSGIILTCIYLKLWGLVCVCVGVCMERVCACVWQVSGTYV